MKKYFSHLSLAVSITLLIYVFYKSEFFWEGTIRYYYTFFYILSIIFVVLSILSFFLKEKTKNFLFNNLIKIILVVYVIEGLLIFYPDNFSRKTTYGFLEKKLKENNKIFLSVEPDSFINEKNIEIFPLSGISNVETIHCKSLGNYNSYTSDRFGFNNPNSVWEEKKIEFLIFGDQVAHGYCVNRPDDIASQLRLLSGKGVLSLGYSGNEMLMDFAALKEFSKSKKIKKIFYLYSDENDNSHLKNEVENFILKKYLSDKNFSQNLILKQKTVDFMAKEKISKNLKEFESQDVLLLKVSKFIKLDRLRAVIYSFKKESGRNIYFPLSDNFRKILIMMENYSKNNNAEFIFVYVPNYKKYTKKNYKNRNYSKILKIIDELDIKFIDLHKNLMIKFNDPTELYKKKFLNIYYQGIWFNKMGNQKIAETIFNFYQ